jgi:hypothetical protein
MTARRLACVTAYITDAQHREKIAIARRAKTTVSKLIESRASHYLYPDSGTRPVMVDEKNSKTMSVSVVIDPALKPALVRIAASLDAPIALVVNDIILAALQDSDLLEVASRKKRRKAKA